MKRIIFLLLIVVLLSACASSTAEPAQVVDDPLAMEEAVTIELTSPAFTHEAAIPERYTCVGEDISPALAWGEPPAGTQSFALIMDDPDAPGGTWVHWVLFNIPASARSLPETFPSDATLPDGSMSGNSSFGGPGYGGPCPPSGTHRYFFKLYALDEMLAISAGATKGELEKAMVGHILATGELMGTFTK
jgi:hypothetical protein